MQASNAFAFPNVTVAAVQTAPAFLDSDATLDIIETKTEEAVSKGAQLVAFSEAFLPGFPTWALVLPPTRQHDLTEALYRQAIDVPGPATTRLSEIASKHETILSVGITERSTRSVGTMWNANLVFGPDGSLQNHRRKLVPTWAEKLVWSNGDASSLIPFESGLGRVGVLICGENTNPLARFALIDRGEQIHIAPYPPAWPTRPVSDATNYDLSHAIGLRSAAHSFEGKLVTVAVAGLVSHEEIAAIAAIDSNAARDIDGAPSPITSVFGPDGRPVVEPLVGTEGTLMATVSLGDSISAKQIHDVSGGYQRFDVFGFEVDRQRRDLGGE